MIKKIFLSLLVVFTFGCSNDLLGTDTGNPVRPKPDDSQNCDGNRRCMPTPYVIMTASKFANKILDCSEAALDGENSTDEQLDLRYNAIYEKVFIQEGLNLEIPVIESTFLLLNQSYQKKLLTVDSIAFGACMEAITKIDCGSDVFTSSFDVNDSENFVNVHKLFRADESCQKIFGRK